jgi:cold shock CspA family protein
MTTRTGTVSAFDEGRGRGTVTADDGTTYEFHATRIADGTRKIPVGVAVEFEVIASPVGEWEAGAVRRV